MRNPWKSLILGLGGCLTGASVAVLIDSDVFISYLILAVLCLLVVVITWRDRKWLRATMAEATRLNEAARLNEDATRATQATHPPHEETHDDR